MGVFTGKITSRPRLMLLGQGGGGCSRSSFDSDWVIRLPDTSRIKFWSWEKKYGHQTDITSAVINILKTFSSIITESQIATAFDYIKAAKGEQWPAILEGIWILSQRAHFFLKDKVFNAWLEKQYPPNRNSIERQIKQIIKEIKESGPIDGTIPALHAFPLSKKDSKTIIEGLSILDPSAYNILSDYMKKKWPSYTLKDTDIEPLAPQSHSEIKEPPKAKPQKLIIEAGPDEKEIRQVGYKVQEKLYEFEIPEGFIHILFTKRYDLIEYIAKKRRNMSTKKFEQKLEQMPGEILAALERSKKGDIKRVFYRFIGKRFYEIWEGK